MIKTPIIKTIGHSNHPFDRFLELLERHQVNSAGHGNHSPRTS